MRNRKPPTAAPTAGRTILTEVDVTALVESKNELVRENNALRGVLSDWLTALCGCRDCGSQDWCEACHGRIYDARRWAEELLEGGSK